MANKERDVGSLASAECRVPGLVAYLLMHMGGKERRPQRHRRGFRVR